MRLISIAEATLDDVSRRVPIWANKYKVSMGDIELAIAADPTRGKYSEWLIRQLQAGNIRLPDDTDKLLANLTNFDKYKSKLPERDIFKYSPGSLAKALDQQLGLTKSQRKAARHGSMQLPPGSELVISDGDYDVVQITDWKAATLLCSGTEWCTANEWAAKRYLKDGPFYLVYHDNVRVALLHFPSSQFKDVNNQDLNIGLVEKFVQLLEPVTGLKYYMIPKLALNIAMTKFKQLNTEFYDEISSSSSRASRWDAISKAEGHGKPKKSMSEASRLREAEPYIMKSNYAAMYAAFVLHDRWPEAEPFIVKDATSATIYATYVLGKRWPEAEPYIMTSAHAISSYADDVLKGRWPEAEPKLLEDPLWATFYAVHVIKGRWPELESKLKNDPDLKLAWDDYRHKMRDKLGVFVLD